VRLGVACGLHCCRRAAGPRPARWYDQTEVVLGLGLGLGRVMRAVPSGSGCDLETPSRPESGRRARLINKAAGAVVEQTKGHPVAEEAA
jgi:hypothetical protein